jgi:SAM-dependent methyltransferase
MQVLEIGGGVSGFQFVLSQLGCNIVNVDPGMELEGVRWSCTPGAIAHMNWLFGTSVELRNTVVAKANLEPSSFDRAFSISVLEHLSDHDLREVVMGVFTALRPGGLFILTIDLFLDVAPFTTRSSNQYGRNVNVRDLVGYAPFEIETGDCTELFGFPEFNADRVQSNLSLYLLGTGYPSLVQCLVLRKPLSL